MLTIHPDIYDDKHSLKQTIEILCDTKNTVTEDAVLNLVTKYFYAYFYPDSHDQCIDPKEIDALREKYSTYFTTREIAFQKANDMSIHEDPLHQFIYTREYPISMLGDIASSTVLVQDIVQRQLAKTLQ